MRSKCLHHHRRRHQSHQEPLHLLRHPDHEIREHNVTQQLMHVQDPDLITRDKSRTAEPVILHPGSCRGNPPSSVSLPDESELCRQTKCRFSGVCQVEQNLKGIVRCSCPDCTEDQQPVCGSDGATYKNECFLRKESCERQMVISMVHTGHCRGCQDLNCTHFSRCQIASNGRAECQCPECPAPAQKRPVCGSNGITYESECQLQMKSCESGSKISVWKEGACGEFMNRSQVAVVAVAPAVTLKTPASSSPIDSLCRAISYVFSSPVSPLCACRVWQCVFFAVRKKCDHIS